MKTIIVITIGLFFAGVASAKDVYVRPYIKADGTYVQGYHRSSPNNTTYDNYSAKGNVSPYTGQVGTIEPYDGGNSRGTSPCFVGPRGGTYTTAKSGRKNYGGC